MDKRVIIKAKGGMGNRMLCAASGILWAKVSGRRPCVDWRDEAYSREGENSFATFFNRPELAAIPREDEVGELFPLAWEGHLHRNVASMLHRYDPDKHQSLTIHRKYSVNPRRYDYTHDTVVFWYYMGQFANLAPAVRKALPGYGGLSTSQIMAKAVREELPLAQVIRTRVERYQHEHWPDAGEVVGVHIRHSDRRSNLDAIERVVRARLAECPGASLFVATDNAGVERHYRETFERVLVTPKWFPPEGKAMHQSDVCQDPVENGIEALTDMYLLARCDRLVYPGRSTFSVISRAVSGLPGSRVTDTDRWELSNIAKRIVRRLTA